MTLRDDTGRACTRPLRLGAIALAAAAMLGAAGCSGTSKPRGPAPNPLSLAEAGECEKAEPLLRCYAVQNAGAAAAQSALGRCLIRSLEAQRQDEGYVWIMRAAKAGDPKAQAALFARYADGPAKNVEEAAFWAFVHSRARYRAVPVPPLDPAQVQAVASALSEAQFAAAEQRALGWTMETWTPGAADKANVTPACREALRLTPPRPEPQRRAPDDGKSVPPDQRTNPPL